MAVRGFTLIELITVVMILSILSLGTVRFINDASEGFAATYGRAALAGDARAALEGVARALRDALPNSVRTTASGDCVEYVPAAGASRYQAIPTTTAALSFQSVPVDPVPVPAGVRVAVFPDADVYTLSGVSVISPTVTVSGPDVNNEVTVTFAAGHRFPQESPDQRYFLVTDPVSFCVTGGRLFRYSGYGFASVQPDVFTLPDTLPGRALLADGVASPLGAFTVLDQSLQRNAVVKMDLTFARRDDQVAFQHLVQLRNVP